MIGKGFLSRILRRNAGEDETRIYPAGEIGTRGLEEKGTEEERQPRGLTFERAAEIIDDLPPDVPRESALRIVRGTLAVAGIEVEDIERAVRTRESQLNSEIDLARSRQKDIRERTEKVVRSLQEEIRKAREARNTGISEEEEKITHALAGLEEARRVRAFFGFPETEGGESTDLAGDPTDDETQVLEPLDAHRTQATRPPGPLADTEELSRDPSTYGTPYDTTDER